MRSLFLNHESLGLSILHVCVICSRSPALVSWTKGEKKQHCSRKQKVRVRVKSLVRNTTQDFDVETYNISNKHRQGLTDSTTLGKFTWLFVKNNNPLYYNPDRPTLWPTEYGYIPTALHPTLLQTPQRAAASALPLNMLACTRKREIQTQTVVNTDLSYCTRWLDQIHNDRSKASHVLDNAVLTLYLSVNNFYR